MKLVLKGLLVIIGLFLLMQAIPYGRTHSNPAVVVEPKWSSPRVRELAVRACFDCHSNETKWPWYSHVAPMSWGVQRHVEAGRSVMNFSEWHKHYPLAHYAGQRALGGMMPPKQYKLAHPEADLTPEELRELAMGLDATIGGAEAVAY